MQNSKLFIGILLFLLLSMTFCVERDGPFEQAGENMDSAVDEARDSLEDVGDEVEDVTDKVGR